MYDITLTTMLVINIVLINQATRQMPKRNKIKETEELTNRYISQITRNKIKFYNVLMWSQVSIICVNVLHSNQSNQLQHSEYKNERSSHWKTKNNGIFTCLILVNNQNESDSAIRNEKWSLVESDYQEKRKVLWAL